MKIENPYTKEIIKEIEEDKRESINKKFQLLKEGQKKWAEESLDFRISCIERFGEALKAKVDSLAELLTDEMGKPLSQAKSEILSVAEENIPFFLEEVKKWVSPKKLNQVDHCEEILSFSPLGVIANISSWNYPYYVGSNIFIPALLTGNALFYKPSEYTTLSGLKIAELLYESGVPKRVFSPAIGGGEVGKLLLELPLDGYFFTGSLETGKSIAKKTKGKLVPINLELGGKDPLYAREDIEDIQKVAEAAASGAFYNSGQSCCAIERIYLHEKIYDQFMEAFLLEAKKLKGENPKEEGVNLGPLTRAEQVPLLNDQINDALEKGASLLMGGCSKNLKSNFFEPTILVDADHSMKVMKEESFGPIIAIQKVQNDEEAIQLMGDTEYGLTASIYSKDIEKSKELLKQLETGTGYINCCDRVSPYLPWSGRKNSGLGSSLSYLGILSFVNPKAFHVVSSL